jgi:hypothetical protein
MEHTKRLLLLAIIFFLTCASVYAATPTLGTITPASGTGQAGVSKSFTTTYSDADGWANIQYVYFLINSSTGTSNCFDGYYNQNTNKLYLRNDAGTDWSGGYAPGSANVIQNSYASLNCAQTTVNGSGMTLTVTWSVTLKAPFTGSKNTYLYVRDDSNAYVSFTKMGTWAIPNNTPQNVSVTPSFGASVPNTIFSITSAHLDPDTWLNIQYVYLLISASSTALTNSPYLYYNQNSNKLYVRNDANSAWLGGYAPGSANVIENSYVKLYCAQTTVTGSAGTMSVAWTVSFKPAFQGVKKVYLYTRDDANAYQNWTQKGTWTTMDSGVVVGSSGGEVLSSDGRVRLVVPAGALSGSTAINIATVSAQTLQGAIPQNTEMINAVDCKPYGLNFNQPVSVIYTLSQAEIPGTPVALGLYDSVNNVINLTGQTSVIAGDGYSVTFSVTHFSTYAALMNLVPQGAPIGGGVKIPLPDMFTGSFGHSVPITIPPGRKGMQPAVGLSYRSGGANSWVGLGFSLNPGYIVRSTRLGPPTYNDATDTFYLITDAGTTELVHLIDNLYQAKIESSFTKFYKEADDTWRVVAKEGSVLRFGQSQDSKETSPLGTFSWYLTRAQDTNGNYMQYSYTKDQGKTYLDRIDYAGHESGVSPTNSVQFILESRGDVASSYVSTSKIVTAKRLREIQVKVSYGLVWRYVLGYTMSQDTNRSLLTSVTQYAGDGNALPVQTFTYQRSSD